MAEEIQKLITLIVDDLKQALDHLFDIIDEDYAEHASGYGRIRKDKLDKIYIARTLYLKHFA